MAALHRRWALAAVLLLASIGPMAGSPLVAQEDPPAGQGDEQTNKETVSIDPLQPNLTVEFGRQKSDPFDLVVRNKGEAVDIWIVGRHLVHDVTKQASGIEFLKFMSEQPIPDDMKFRNRNDWLSAKLEKGQSLFLSWRVSTARTVGAYTGKIEVKDPKTGKLLTSVDVKVHKLSREMNVTLLGAKKGAALVLTPHSPTDRRLPLTLKNDGKSLVALKLETLLFRGKDTVLEAKAVDDETNTIEELRLEAGTEKRIFLDFGQQKLPVRGKTTGQLVVKDRDDEELTRIFEIELAPLKLNLEIIGQKDNEPLEFTATGASDNEFKLRAKNPTGAPSRELEVTGDVDFEDEKDVKIVTLERGVKHDGSLLTVPFKFETEGMPQSGSYEGWLTIRDKQNPELTQNVAFKLTGDYATSEPVLIIIAFTVAGAVLSFIFYVYLPRSLRHINLRSSLKTLEKRVDGLPALDESRAGPAAAALRNNLEIDLHRVRASLSPFSAIRPSYVDRMAELDEGLKRLGNLVERIETAISIRDRIWSDKAIPFGLRDDFEEDLRDMEWQLALGDDEGAKPRLDAHKARIADRAFFAEYKGGLPKRIETQLKPREDGRPLAAEAWINALIEELRAYAHPAKIPGDSFGRLDQSFAVVETYLGSFSLLAKSGRTLSPTEREGVLDLLRGGVASGTQLRLARQRIRSLQTGVGMTEVLNAVRNRELNVGLSQSKPRPGELVAARCTFNDERIEAEYALTTQLDYEWTFGDESNSWKGKDCVHVFDETAANRNFRVSLRVTSPKGALQKDFGPMPVYVRSKLQRPTDASIVEAASFFIAVLIACLVGINVQFENLQAAPMEAKTTFEFIQRYFPAFLWGFALDQAKGSFVSAFKKLRATPAGAAAQAVQ